MSALLWRVLVAVVCVLIAFALIPPVLRVFQLGISADVMTIVNICVGGLALLYVIKGPPVWKG
jgi:hypothetical protein